MRTTKQTLLLFSLVTVACGGGSSEQDPGSAQQAVTCGGVTCQVGQYCYDERFAQCENGCLADSNCAENQFCDKTKQPDPLDANVGSCENKQQMMMMPPNTNELARCKAACTVLTMCSAITAADGADCDNGCNGASESQRKAVGDCAGSWDCSGNIPGCTGLECGPDYPCGQGATCVGGNCL